MGEAETRDWPRRRVLRRLTGVGAGGLFSQSVVTVATLRRAERIWPFGESASPAVVHAFQRATGFHLQRPAIAEKDG